VGFGKSSKSIMRLAIGGFDGMHYAHQKLFSLSNEILVIEKNSTLTPFESRCEYTNLPCYFYNLDEIKHLTHLEFIEKLKKEFNPSSIVIGYDFRFGKNRLGTPEILHQHFDVTIVDEIQIDNIGVHSKVIREFLKNGFIKKANKFLNHLYKIKATQIKGQGIGKNELLATINLKPTYNYIIPKDGVYLTLINKLPSITFIGTRSTDNNFSIETHVLNIEFQMDNGELLELEFLELLRETKKFDNIFELKKAIITDKENAIEYFKKENYDIR
jgi:riboflavin kinase/FMN adenylyltransferase